MLTIRNSRPNDAPLIVDFIKELAIYEKLEHECRADAAAISAALFGATPRAFCILVEWDGQPAAFCLFFYNFSTFEAKTGLYIEDVFVRPSFRRKGIARAIFEHCAQRALAEGCARMEWSVLNWNVDAIEFYRSLGAKGLDEWTIQRLTGAALRSCADGV